MTSTEQNLQDTLDGLKADLDTLSESVATAVSTAADQVKTITALQQRIADLQAGQPVSQLQLDNLVSEANTLKAQADGIVATLAQAPAPTDAPSDESAPV